MISVKKINGGIKCEMSGGASDLMRELGHTSAILFAQALKDDMSKQDLDDFWEAWRGLIELEMAELKEEMDDKPMQ